MRAETLHALVLVATFAGLALSIYAAYETYVPAAQSTCSVNAFVSCGKVDASGHTSTLGVPDWAWGVGGFVALVVAEVGAYRTWKRPWLIAVALLSAAGLALSVNFAYVELVVIGALCPVCTSAYAMDAIVLAGSLALLRVSRERRDETAPGTDGAATA